MIHRIFYPVETDTERRCCELHPVNLTAKSEHLSQEQIYWGCLMTMADSFFHYCVVCIPMLKCTCTADSDNLLLKLFIPDISHIKLMIIILGVRLIQSDSVWSIKIALVNYIISDRDYHWFGIDSINNRQWLSLIFDYSSEVKVIPVIFCAVFTDKRLETYENETILTCGVSSIAHCSIEPSILCGSHIIESDLSTPAIFHL